eukprot:6977893-Prymnesium_polylepis.1
MHRSKRSTCGESAPTLSQRFFPPGPKAEEAARVEPRRGVLVGGLHDRQVRPRPGILSDEAWVAESTYERCVVKHRCKRTRDEDEKSSEGSRSQETREPARSERVGSGQLHAGCERVRGLA